MQRRAHFFRSPLNYCHGLRGLLGADHRYIRLDDAGLLAGDLRQRITEKFRMVHTDWRDDAGERRIDHVCCVETAAESDFQEQHIGRMFGKQTERSGSFDFEYGDRLAAIGALAAIQRIAQLIVGGEHPAPYFAETKSLVKAHQMGRGIDMDPQSRSLEDGAHERHGRTLAIGAPRHE